MATQNGSQKIPVLPVRPSKEQEIAFLHAVCDAIPTESYLDRLLDGFRVYAEQQIRDDMAIGLLQYRESFETCRSANEMFQADNLRLETENKKIREQYDRDMAVWDELVKANYREISQLRAASERDKKTIDHLLALQEVLQLEAHQRRLTDEMKRTEKGLTLARETLTANPMPVAESAEA